MTGALCTFCEIVAGRLPSNIRHDEDEILAFDNLLDWVPVMILLVPKRHLSQTELWNSGDLMSRMSALAVQLGDRNCPSGFRVVSNFGSDGRQTQPHGHLHVIGGTRLGLYAL